eukprot:361619-Chlamydomonas_euryale.AAC.3
MTHLAFGCQPPHTTTAPHPKRPSSQPPQLPPPMHHRLPQSYRARARLRVIHRPPVLPLQCGCGGGYGIPTLGAADAAAGADCLPAWLFVLRLGPPIT